jgi:hypothetical protein
MKIVVLISMPPVTRSVSNFFEREKIPEKERKKMLEAAYALLALSKSTK